MLIIRFFHTYIIREKNVFVNYFYYKKSAEDFTIFIDLTALSKKT